MPANKPISVLFIVLMASLCRGLNWVWKTGAQRNKHGHRLCTWRPARRPATKQPSSNPLTKSYQGSGKSLTFSDASTKTLYNVEEEGRPAGGLQPSQQSFQGGAPPRADRGQHPAPAAPPAGRGDSLPGRAGHPQGLAPPLQQPPLPQNLPGPAAGSGHQFQRRDPGFQLGARRARGRERGRSPFPPPAPPQHLPLLPPLSPFAEGSPPRRLAKTTTRTTARGSSCCRSTCPSGREHRGGRAGGGRGGGDLPAPSKPTPEASPALTPPSPFRDLGGLGQLRCPAPPCPSRCSAPLPMWPLRSVILRDYKQSSSTP